MICCLGLFAGVYVGSMLGGPWTIIAPIVGFGLGLVGDSKLMGNRSCHQGDMEKSTDSRTPTLEDHEDQEVVIHPPPADIVVYTSGPVLQAGPEGEG